MKENVNYFLQQLSVSKKIFHDNAFDNNKSLKRTSGDMEGSSHFLDKISLLSGNGAKTVLVPMDNLNEITTISSSVLGKTDIPFYANSQMLLQKAVK